MGPLRQILMAYCPLFTDAAIKTDFDGILPCFDLSGIDRHILVTFSQVSLMAPIEADFDGILPPYDLSQQMRAWFRFLRMLYPGDITFLDLNYVLFKMR